MLKYKHFILENVQYSDYTDPFDIVMNKEEAILDLNSEKEFMKILDMGGSYRDVKKIFLESKKNAPVKDI